MSLLDDVRWETTRKACGWELPKSAPWPLRLPVIRNIRALFASIAVERHYVDIEPFGGLRTGYDEWVLYAIARGWC